VPETLRKTVSAVVRRVQRNGVGKNGKVSLTVSPLTSGSCFPTREFGSGQERVYDAVQASMTVNGSAFSPLGQQDSAPRSRYGGGITQQSY